MPSMLKNKLNTIASPRIWLFLGLITLGVMFLRWPAFELYSIDDVAYLTASERSGMVIDRVFLTWNRYIVFLFHTAVDFFLPLNERTLSFGYFFMAAGLVGYIYALARLFKLHCKFWSYALIVYFSLFPILYILFHFTLIQFSISFVFAALIGLIVANASGPKALRIIFSTAIATVIIAGSYQSGMYYLFITLSLLVYYFSRDIGSVLKLMKICIFFVVGLAIGIMIFSLIGKVVDQYVPLKSSFSPRPISLWVGELIDRMSNFRILDRHWQQMPGWEQQLAFGMSIILLSLSFLSKQTRAPQRVSMVFILITILFCYVQILTLPVEFNSKSVRSFWFIPMLFVSASIVFMDCFAETRKAWIKYVGYAATTFTVIFATLFIQHTLQQNEGYVELRAKDHQLGVYMSEQVIRLNTEMNDAVVIEWSNNRTRNQYHRDTIGAIRSLFWAEWSKYRYLQTFLEEKLVYPSQKQKIAGRMKCRESKDKAELPRVTKETGYILACI